MKIETKYDIKDKVKILELERSGYITAIYIGRGYYQYYVRYFDKCEAKDVYFYEQELQKI